MYKYINKYTVEQAKPYVIVGDEVITNPPVEMLTERGYKPMVYGDEPIYNEDTEYIMPIYTDFETYILQGYEVVPMNMEVENNGI